MRDHRMLDQRSFAMHKLAAAKIRQNPALFQNVVSTLERWRKQVCASSRPYLDEWDVLVTRGMDACLEKAIEESEHAAALRQASPFSSVLTNQERFEFLKQWGREHDS